MSPCARPGWQLLAGMVMAGFLTGMTPAMAEPEAQDPVAAAAAHFLRVFDALDFEAFRACWAAEPSVFFPFNDTPERVSGRDAVEARFQRFFDETRQRGSGPPYLHLAPRDLRIEHYGDTALVTFMLGGGRERLGRRTLVFVQDRGTWKLVHLHASNLDP